MKSSGTPVATSPANVNDAIREAQSLMKASRFAEAEPVWRSALQARPDSAAAAIGLTRSVDAAGRRPDAEQLLREWVAASPAPANIMAAATVWEQWEKSPGPHARTVRIAVTGSGTLSPLSAHLRVAIAQTGLHPIVYTSEFGRWGQDLLAADSPLFEASPGIIIIALSADALFPGILDSVFSADSLAAGVAQIETLVSNAHKFAPGATVILNTFSIPTDSPFGMLDLVSEHGIRQRFDDINRAIVQCARSHSGHVLLFDQDRAEASHGKARVRDERMWYMASMPYSDTFLPVLATEYVKLIRAITGLTKKCIVVDLDNTLWGGVIGEDGINKIKIGGTSAPGNAFADFQRALKQFKERGILLAICSKNNPDDVWPVFAEHPQMILRREDFAAARVNWRDKATNIEELAKELNIGADSLVFLDDNPAERELVRSRLPHVLTVELPRDPAQYRQAVVSLGVFETLALTDEDRRRSELYREQQLRDEYRVQEGQLSDVNAYLAGLDMAVEIGLADDFTIPRIAQLIGKTNQFNVTTRRYTEAEVQAMAQSVQDWRIVWISVSDRFGDSGLTGVAIIRKAASEWEIDSFLLSCRVLGRGVEQALLRYIVDDAMEAGADRLRGIFIPTSKNAPAADLFPRMGFENDSVDESLWILSLRNAESLITFPTWLKLNIKEH